MAFQEEIQLLDARIIEDLAVYLKGLKRTCRAARDH